MRDSPIPRLALAVLAGYLSLGAAIQVLPQDARERFGASDAGIGAAVTAAALAAVVARPAAGRVADRGSARIVVVTGAALAALAAVGQLLAPSLAALTAARLLAGAGEGALFTGALAWVLRTAPAERRGRIVGHFGLSMWGGLAAGPPLAAALAAAAGTRAVWVMAAALPAAALCGVATLREAAVTVPRAGGQRSGVARAVLAPAIALGLAAYGVGTLQAFAVLRLGGSVADVLLGAFGVAFLVTRLAFSPLVDRHPAARLMAASAALEAVGLGLLATSDAAVPAVAGAALTGVGAALVFPVLAATVAARAHGRGVAVGALTSFWDAGIAAAGPVGGLAVAAGGLPAAFALAAGAAGLAALPLRIRPGARRS